jgi:hypothetical protein
LNRLKLFIGGDPLQHFTENQISETQPFSRQLNFKPIGMGSTCSPEVIDPYRRSTIIMKPP